LSIAKTVALCLLSSAGVFRIGRALSRRSLVVLTYHRVVTKDQSGARPSNALFSCDFEKQIEYLVSRYHITTGEEARLFLSGEGNIPANSVLLTFDDGYENNYTEAFPVLRRYGVTAVFFLTAGLIGNNGPRLWFDALDELLSANSLVSVIDCLHGVGLPADYHNERAVRKWFKNLSRRPRENAIATLTERLRGRAEHNNVQLTKLMTWEQAREMASAGMTFGSHTQTHQILTSAMAEEREQELVTSRVTIEEEIGRPCWAFAYPNGESSDFSAADKAALKAAGYVCAFTQMPGLIASTVDPYALPRIPVPDTDDIRVFASRVSGVHQWRSIGH